MSVFLLGPNGQMTELVGQRGKTPIHPDAHFKKGDVVRIRRLMHLRHLPERGAVAAVVPPGFSPDYAWADLCGKPRPLMHQIGTKITRYIVAFDNDPTPHLLREKDLRPTDEAPVEIGFAP